MMLADLCFEVCTALNAVGTQAVLTGGSAATFYAPQAYQSVDADFVITFGNSSNAAQALLRLGFKEKNGIYRRDGTTYTIDFPPGPLMIGSDHIHDVATIPRGDEVLYVLHPTDCVRDRLLWYYHYADFSALAAAVGVAESNAVDMGAIHDWSVRERTTEKFGFFNRQIATAEKRGSKTKALPC